MSVLSMQKVLQYMNQARTRPRVFAQHIENQIQSFINQKQIVLTKNRNIVTKEGKRPWIQLVKILQSLQPLPPYKLSQSLTLAAEDHAADMALNYFFGHQGSDGARAKDRIYRRGKRIQLSEDERASIAENIGGDFIVQNRNNQLNCVVSLLVDDGVLDRKHRQNMLSQTFKYVGIGSRVVKDKKTQKELIRVVIQFHTHNPTLINSSLPCRKAGTKINYQQSKKDDNESQQDDEVQDIKFNSRNDKKFQEIKNKISQQFKNGFDRQLDNQFDNLRNKLEVTYNLNQPVNRTIQTNQQNMNPNKKPENKKPNYNQQNSKTKIKNKQLGIGIKTQQKQQQNDSEDVHDDEVYPVSVKTKTQYQKIDGMVVLETVTKITTYSDGSVRNQSTVVQRG